MRQKSFNDYPELMTIEEVAGYLRISLPLAYQMAQRGTLRGLKVGRLWRFYKSDIDKFLKAGAQITSRAQATRQNSLIFNMIPVSYYSARPHQVKRTAKGGWILIRTDEKNIRSPLVKIQFRNVRLSSGEKAIVISRRAYGRIPKSQRSYWNEMRIKPR